MSEPNILDIIENTPLTRLTESTNNKFIEKIKQTFTNNEQKLFIGNFYCYLNHNNNFVVDLDNIWKWLEFSTKQKTVLCLTNNFVENIDYIISSLNPEDKHEIGNKGGHNKIKYLLTVRCFKLLCLKAQTKKADEIHNYYICLEELINDSLNEDACELKQMLLNKDKYINDILTETEIQKQQLVISKNKEIEKAIIEQFPVNTECIYIGTIDNTNDNNEKLLKFGHSNDLKTRVHHHHGNSYYNFCLKYAFKVNNRTEIENAIKSHCVIKKYIRKICINGKHKTEIIAYNSDFTIDNLIYYIKDIIKRKTYSVENFNKLLEICQNQENNINLLNDKINNLLNENNIIKLENNELKTTINNQQELINQIHKNQESVYHIDNNYNNTEILIQKYIAECCIIRPDVEESAANIEGQFRIWNRLKPKKELFHELKNYFDTNFRKIRLAEQTKNQLVYGYSGIKLIPIVYNKKYASPIHVETFLFQECKFCPNGKILNATLLNSYNNWKNNLNIEYTNNELNELKDYLNNCNYVLKATVWTTEGSNEGYYGITLKSIDNNNNYKKTSSTGKPVIKIDVVSNIVLAKWETIAKAAVSENISSTKMSRYVKNKTIIDNNYYYDISKK